jgi:hypothetical protein
MTEPTIFIPQKQIYCKFDLKGKSNVNGLSFIFSPKAIGFYRSLSESGKNNIM